MGAATAFRFAVQTPGAATADAWRTAVRRAEDLGYDVLTLPDHFGSQLSPIPALAAAAMASSRIRLSMFVLANDWRNPAGVARDVATIDALSGGRVELGMGAGWNADEYAQIGAGFDPPVPRIARLAEAVE